MVHLGSWFQKFHDFRTRKLLEPSTSKATPYLKNDRAKLRPFFESEPPIHIELLLDVLKRIFSEPQICKPLLSVLPEDPETLLFNGGAGCEKIHSEKPSGRSSDISFLSQQPVVGTSPERKQAPKRSPSSLHDILARLHTCTQLHKAPTPCTVPLRLSFMPRNSLPPRSSSWRSRPQSLKVGTQRHHTQASGKL